MDHDQGEPQPTGIEITKSEGIDWGKVWHTTGVVLALGVGASVAWAANYRLDAQASLILGGTAMALTEAAFLAVTAVFTKEKIPSSPKPRKETTSGYMPPPKPESDATKAIKEAWRHGQQRGGSSESIKAALEKQRQLTEEARKRGRGKLFK